MPNFAASVLVAGRTSLGDLLEHSGRQSVANLGEDFQRGLFSQNKCGFQQNHLGGTVHQRLLYGGQQSLEPCLSEVPVRGQRLCKL